MSPSARRVTAVVILTFFAVAASAQTSSVADRFYQGVRQDDRLVLLIVSGNVLAVDVEIEAVNRAQRLLALRGHRLSTVIVLNEWPIGAPSREAFALRGTIYVNSAGRILAAAVRSTRFDVVLASLLLHEQAHLAGADECRALQIELAWLTSEHADDVVIQEIRRAIARELRNRAPLSATGDGSAPRHSVQLQPRDGR